MSYKNKNYGKNINMMEKLSGKLMSELIEEAVCFGSIKDYAKAFVRVYNRAYRDIDRVMRTLREFAISTRGREWYKKNFDRGEKYLQKAAKCLGVPSHLVIEHIVTKEIDIVSLSHLLGFDNYIKAYNFFYTRCSRYKV